MQAGGSAAGCWSRKITFKQIAQAAATLQPTPGREGGTRYRQSSSGTAGRSTLKTVSCQCPPRGPLAPRLHARVLATASATTGAASRRPSSDQHTVVAMACATSPSTSIQCPAAPVLSDCLSNLTALTQHTLFMHHAYVRIHTCLCNRLRYQPLHVHLRWQLTQQALALSDHVCKHFDVSAGPRPTKCRHPHVWTRAHLLLRVPTPPGPAPCSAQQAPVRLSLHLGRANYTTTRSASICTHLFSRWPAPRAPRRPSPEVIDSASPRSAGSPCLSASTWAEPATATSRTPRRA